MNNREKIERLSSALASEAMRRVRLRKLLAEAEATLRTKSDKIDEFVFVMSNGKTMDVFGCSSTEFAVTAISAIASSLIEENEGALITYTLIAREMVKRCSNKDNRAAVAEQFASAFIEEEFNARIAEDMECGEIDDD